jgi:hypothetical protein
MRRGEGNPKDSRNDKKYLMQSEKRKKELKCFEARIDSGDELPFNHDHMSQSNPGTAKPTNLLYCLELKNVDSREEGTDSIREPESKKLR